jgi:hypothetical protein
MRKLTAIVLAGGLAITMPAIGLAQTSVDAGATVTVDGGLTFDDLSTRVGTTGNLEGDLNLINESTDIRIINVAQVGGSVDAIRAAAVAGVDVQATLHTAVGGNSFISKKLEDEGFENGDVVAVYMDVNGVFWVYVDEDDEDDQPAEPATPSAPTPGTGG